jgi:hypothetical protein
MPPLKVVSQQGTESLIAFTHLSTSLLIPQYAEKAIACPWRTENSEITGFIGDW